jgi:hypothetical protein
MIQCSVCKEFFNPELLSKMIEHIHLDKEIKLDKEYYGTEKDD